VNNLTKKNVIQTSRRYFLKLGAFGLLAGFYPSSIFAKMRDLPSSEKSLSLYNLHTEESLDTVYWNDGEYLDGPLTKIDFIMRDHRTGETKSIDTRLLDLLYSIQKRLNGEQPFHIISGYRSPQTNSILRKNDRGVSGKSLHMLGKAVDIRLPEVELSSLRKVTMDLRVGGVGYYPRSDFIHVDLGRLRYWTG
jgi:uncharacterized protein YcbK (DUF882 family)